MSGQQEHSPPLLLAAPGKPGSYDPPVPPEDRPATVAEMEERVRVATPEPWPAGTWVQMGARGRRGHWTGTQWKCNPSPGYAAGEVVTANRSETEQTTEDTQP